MCVECPLQKNKTLFSKNEELNKNKTSVNHFQYMTTIIALMIIIIRMRLGETVSRKNDQKRSNV